MAELQLPTVLALDCVWVDAAPIHTGTALIAGVQYTFKLTERPIVPTTGADIVFRGVQFDVLPSDQQTIASYVPREARGVTAAIFPKLNELSPSGFAMVAKTSDPSFRLKEVLYSRVTEILINRSNLSVIHNLHKVESTSSHVWIMSADPIEQSQLDAIVAFLESAI